MDQNKSTAHEQLCHSNLEMNQHGAAMFQTCWNSLSVAEYSVSAHSFIFWTNQTDKVTREMVFVAF